MHPKYVKPYVKTNKNDRRDAEAICEAVSRPAMRCVSNKTVEQADLQTVHRTRSLFVKHRTAVINQIRGLVVGQSPEKVRPALVRFLDDAASGVTVFARETFAELYAQLTELDARIARVTHRVERVYRAHPVCQKLAAVPEIGFVTAAYRRAATTFVRVGVRWHASAVSSNLPPSTPRSFCSVAKAGK